MLKTDTAKRVGAIRATLALASILGVSTIGTLAAWTDESQGVTTFSAGSVDLKFDSTSDTPLALTSLSFANAAPGTVKVAPLTVNNTGTMNFTYAMATSLTTTSSPSLAPALRVTIAVGATTCEGSTLTGGTVLVGNAALSDLPAIASRALAASASESLCFKVELPSDAATAYQGTNVTATFAFTATQS